MTKRTRHLLTSDFILSMLYRCIRGYAWTFKLKVENEHIWKDHIEKGGAVVLSCWHQQFFSAIRHFQNYKEFKPPLMISRSTDGEIIAGVASRTGWDPVRGSSSKGGKDALQEMIEKLKQRKLSAHIVDGPRGPMGKIKPGIIRLARAGNAVIVPFYTSADRAWFFNSWDRFMIPKPFANVKLRFGDIFHIDKIENAENFEQQRLDLEKIMLDGLLVQ
jgi:lysophospholipid acyltransferase (LPLAT)-like uncharacterized protein